MKILELRVNNIGVFRGDHSFRLAKSQRENTVHDGVLFVGHNGAGKSTLFQSLAIGLHGAQALGDRISRKSYSESLTRMIHRRNESGSFQAENTANISITIEYVESGNPAEIRIAREWHRSGTNVIEELEVYKDGVRLIMDAEDCQPWINELVPPGLSGIIFFDTEKLDALSSPEYYRGIFGQSIQRLLGLDIASRLDSDLARYASSRGGGSPTIDRMRNNVVRVQQELDALNSEQQELIGAIEHADAEHLALVELLDRRQEQLSQEGGAFASRLNSLTYNLDEIQTQFELATRQLQDSVGGLLPFTLVGQLCRNLESRLRLEESARQASHGRAIIDHNLPTIDELSQDEGIWLGLSISSDVRRMLSERVLAGIRSKIDRYEAEDLSPQIHQLSRAETEKILGWIREASTVVPSNVVALGKELRQLREERIRIQSELQRVPDDDVIAPIQNEISRISDEIQQIDKARQKLRERLGGYQYRRQEIESRLRRAAEDLTTAQMGIRQLELAERSRAAIRTYQDVLLKHQLSQLEGEIVSAFNSICHKEHLLDNVEISPSDLRITLVGRSGSEYRIGEFSAGERQLFSLSLLRALRRVSRRELPLIIDTPLARLDERHRSRILKDYLPSARSQLILFATDTEFDDTIIRQNSKNFDRVYRVSFEEDKQEARVVEERPIEGKPTWGLVQV